MYNKTSRVSVRSAHVSKIAGLRANIPLLGEDKRATTNVQNGLVFFFFSLLKSLTFKRSPGGKMSEQNVENVWKSAETILPFSCCPLVFL